MEKKVSCFKCEYFYITWDHISPRGCSYYGIKTSEIPSYIVAKSSGVECMAFKEKKQKLKDKDSSQNEG